VRCSECTGDFSKASRAVEPKELITCDFCNAEFYISKKEKKEE